MTTQDHEDVSPGLVWSKVGSRLDVIHTAHMLGGRLFTRS